MGAAAPGTRRASDVASRPRAPGLLRRPRFSVVIPAYNEENFIGDCLDSLSRQDFGGRYEIIVVDNNSADDTARVARSRGATVVLEERQGVCWARQRGSELAAGEIIISTDADTVYPADWISRIDQEFRRDAAVVAVAGPFRFAAAPWWARAWTGALFGYVRAVSALTRRVPYIPAANVAFRADAWTGYETWATQGGDELDLLRRLQARGRVAFVHDNRVLTSPRRLSRGMAYGIFVTIFYYYAFGYLVNRLARRRVVGMAPAVRASTASATTARASTARASTARAGAGAATARWRLLLLSAWASFIIAAAYLCVRW
jgi:glycosyltransferase involved in cell wall biosynthesis